VSEYAFCTAVHKQQMFNQTHPKHLNQVFYEYQSLFKQVF